MALKTYTTAELNVILRNHKHWIDENANGWETMRADLHNADLSYADLRRKFQIDKICKF